MVKTKVKKKVAKRLGPPRDRPKPRPRNKVVRKPVKVQVADQPLRLNLGGGDTKLEGYVNVDRKDGQEAYPLTCPDASVEEIYASHVLEHFPHAQVPKVLENWVSKLKPGGRLRVAVPDFLWIATEYKKKRPIPVQAYVMGGQQDKDDYHKAVFDREALNEAMINVGLERIRRWEADAGVVDCSSLPCSVNLQGYKPTDDRKVCEKTQAILSCPRYGPLLHTRSVNNAFGRARVPYAVGFGAYWHQVLSEQLEEAIASDAEFVITSDYDSLFTYHDVVELWRLIRACDDVDAICALQCKRGGEDVLIGMDDATGKPRNRIYKAEFATRLTRVQRGHFGLTIFRCEALRKQSKPWMLPVPSKEGRWDEGKVDADIYFWRKWLAEGRSLYLASQVVIGHIEEVVSWPTEDMKTTFQMSKDYYEHGMPAEVCR